jgi:tRNA-binding EMAP/Myf-like protein
MQVITMKVTEAQKHPNADNLRIYKFTAPDYKDIQIIANLENVYDVGDVAYVALAGCVLKDGTKISRALIRGADSFGMALGHSPEKEIGRDFTDKFCRKIAKSVIKWPSIEGFHHINKSMKVRKKGDPEFVPPVVTYYAKVKLHGTNAGVQISKEGVITPQSRTSVLTTDKDNLGFAKWVYENEEWFKKIKYMEDIVIFGEFCGKGIQKGVAISSIDRKVFVVFAIQVGSYPLLIVDPPSIESLLPKEKHDDIFVLPWYSGPSVLVDWDSKESLEAAVIKMNQMVADVEKCDPWVAKIFSVEGTGEGLVFYPLLIGGGRYSYNKPNKIDKDSGSVTVPMVNRNEFSWLVFKAKDNGSNKWRI